MIEKKIQNDLLQGRNFTELAREQDRKTCSRMQKERSLAGGHEEGAQGEQREMDSNEYGIEWHECGVERPQSPENIDMGWCAEMWYVI